MSINNMNNITSIIHTNYLNFITDYDNTLLNCDSDFLWNKLLFKLDLLNYNFCRINFFFFKLYEKKKLSIKNYIKFNSIYYNKYYKIKEIYKYIIKIFQNNFLFLKNINFISTSTNKFLVNSTFYIYNKYLYSTLFNFPNINNFKIININKNLKNINVFISDSLNDIFSLLNINYKILINVDTVIYKIFKNYKKINLNFIYI